MIKNEYYPVMYKLLNTQIEKDRYDLIAFFLELEKIAGDFFEKGRLNEGDHFVFPIENGDHLKCVFYRNGTDLYHISPSGKETCLMDRSSQITFNEIHKVLSAILKKESGLGERFPKKFKEDILSLKPGDTMVTSDMHSYVCTDRDEDTTTLVKYGAGSYDLSSDKEKIIINVRENSDLQSFFRQVRKDCKYSENYSIEKADSINRKISKITKQIKRGAAAELKIGPETIKVKKSIITGKPIWFKGKNRIPEDHVKAYMTLIDKAPTKFIYERTQKDEISDFNDDELRKAVNNLFSKCLYEEAGADMMAYCQDNKGELQINMQTYHDNKAYSFVFKYDEETKESFILKLTYDEDNFAKDIKTSEEISLKEFTAFCEEKYNESYRFIEHSIAEQIRQAKPELTDAQIQAVLTKSDIVSTKVSAMDVFRQSLEKVSDNNKNFVDTYKTKGKGDVYERF